MKRHAESFHRQADGPLLAPSSYGAGVLGNVERDGYRAKPGTSIAIRFEAGMLGALNLHDAIEKYLCGSRVPVYYNNERIGQTYEEIMRAAHEEEGEKIYEMTPKMKEEFDRSFPAVCGKYPKIAVTVIPLDKEENQVLPELSGFLVKYDVSSDEVLQWKVRDQIYEIFGRFVKIRNIIKLEFACRNKKDSGVWNRLTEKYDIEKVAALEAEFEKYSSCPKAEDMMEIWEPFVKQMELYEAWRSYNDNKIVNCLCEDSAEDIAEKCNYIREQMLRFPENHGVDVSAFPQLRLTDFWLTKEECEDFVT